MKKFEESEYIELKKSTSELKEAIVSIAAMLNKHGRGELYFGIKNNGEVVGQQVSEKTLRDVSQHIANYIKPEIYPVIEKVIIEDKSCVYVEFQGNSDELYYAFGIPYIRVSDEDRKLSPQQIKKLIIDKYKSAKRWDSEVSDAELKDIDAAVIRNFVDKAYKAGRIPFSKGSADTVIKKLFLIKKDRLINAGKVLFCKNANIEFQMAVFAGIEKLTFIDIDRVKGNIFYLLDKAEEYIRKHINWRVQFGKMEREEIPEIPITSLREALVNSLCHRDYTVPESNKVAIFKDRVEIYNPGSFPETLTPEDFIKKDEESVLRNLKIADILYKAKEVETWATGLKRIYNECTNQGIKIKFECLKTGFKIIFYRKLISEDQNIYQKRLPEKVASKSCQKIIELMQDNNKITISELSAMIGISKTSVKNNISALKEKGVVKRLGPDKGGYWELQKI